MSAIDPRLNEWAERAGAVVEPELAAGPTTFALYARVSTEDLQSPEDSLARQREAAEALIGDSGEITEVYFDIGLSRSLPWSRRPEAARLLTELSSPTRSWSAVVVGEFDRAFYGSQFTETAHRFVAAQVPLWAPLFGGPWDPNNMSQDVQAVVTGVLSRVERQRVQERVRGSMRTLAKQGRHLGGRPPYGYRTVGYAPHPNPRKAAEGFQLKRLEPHPETAPIVERIFRETLDGRSNAEVTRRLNEEGVLCPSAQDPARNTHRSGAAWQQSTVSTILGNLVYTGFSVWGKTRKTYQLLDPTNPSLGEVKRFVRSEQPPIVSAQPTHEPIVSLDDFLTVDAMRRASASRGQRGTSRHRPVNDAALQGRVFCSICDRKMQLDRTNSGRRRYRCSFGYDAPGSGHPKKASVNEAPLLEIASGHLEHLFSLANREHLIQTLITAAGEESRAEHEARTKLAAAKDRLARLLDALENGVIDYETLQPRLRKTKLEVESLQLRRDANRVDRPRPEDIRKAVDALTTAGAEVFGPDRDVSLLRRFFDSIRLRVHVDVNAGTVIVSSELFGTDTQSEAISWRGPRPQG